MRNLSPILRDSYKDFVANLLQIPPYLLRFKSDEKVQNIDMKRNIDAEDILLKSILEDSSLLDFALDYLSDDIFVKKEAFLALKCGDVNHKDLLGIAIDSNIKALKYADFKEQMRLFLINSYQKLLQRLKHDNSVSDKITLAFMINQKVNLLKNGSLVRYERYF